MSYSSIVIANCFLDLASSHEFELPPMTNMKVQKLTYIAHGFSLAMINESLTFHHVHAFEWGPVIPVLYKVLKKFANGPIPGPIEIEADVELLDIADSTSEFSSIIKGVWQRYSGFTAAQLSNITHKTGTPWDVTWKENPYGVIDNDLIQSHYLGLLNPA